jgi:hypothetical protein
VANNDFSYKGIEIGVGETHYLYREFARKLKNTGMVLAHCVLPGSLQRVCQF